MGNVKLNLNTLYSEKIHVPTIRGSANRSPLYANDSSNADELRNINRDTEWLAHAAKTYNSPTNVRRIILTKKCVVIQFYKPFIVNNEPDSEYWRYRVADSDIADAVDYLVYSALNANNANGDMAYDKSNHYSITGNILQPIRAWMPWC